MRSGRSSDGRCPAQSSCRCLADRIPNGHASTGRRADEARALDLDLIEQPVDVVGWVEALRRQRRFAKPRRSHLTVLKRSVSEVHCGSHIRLSHAPA
jgi:hypothetical protein